MWLAWSGSIAPRCAISVLLLASACGDDDVASADAGVDGPVSDGGPDGGPPDPAPPAPLDGLTQTARHRIPELSGHAYIVRVEHDVPHVYAENRLDAWRVLGFAMAKDRFFQMDLTSRLSRGEISELLGDAALSTDLENRMFGAAHLTNLAVTSLTSEEAAELDAFAEGVNAYIEACRARQLFPPRELELAALILGASHASDLMEPWDRRAVAAAGITALYGTSFETDEVGRTATLAVADSLFGGFPNRDLRLAGLRADIMNHYAPPNDSSSAAGWGIDTDGSIALPIHDPRRPRRSLYTRPFLPQRDVVGRLVPHLERFAALTARDPDEGYGSNEWAVMGSATADGSSILAGDGHLQLSVPALFWRFGVDTVLMGADTGEETRIVGSTIAGLAMMGTGTNGRVAWTQTAFFADVTDWYTEEVVLGSDGLPMSSMFEGTPHPLTRVDESIVIADIEALESVGRTEVIPRFVTFDGRFITSIEGRPTTPEEPLGPGEARLNVMGDLIVPGDVDGDGAVSAVSFYYGPFDGGSLFRAFRGFSLADDVVGFREAMRNFIGYGGSMAASDSAGSIFQSAYHAVPCRSYLPRDSSNVWLPGADPRYLLDGTAHPAWRIPLDAEGRVDEAAAVAGGPTACAVPFDEWPQALNPTKQYVHHGNNDPGNITTDDNLFDDPHYIGGPWIEGYRAARMEELLSGHIAAGTVTIDAMARMQGDHHSNLGAEWADELLATIEDARSAAAGTPAPGTPEARMAARFIAAEADYEEVERRIEAWIDAGLPTPSGVETFYSTPAAGDVDNSIATTIFHAWLSTYFDGVLGDEGIPSDLSPAATGDTYRTQTLQLMRNGRGPGNPLGLGSWDPATQESVFFDDARTSEVESSREIALRSLDEAIAFLRSPPTETMRGGYGTDDWGQYLWGMRHMVRFDALVADFLGSDSGFEFVVDMFNITPEMLPLLDDLPDTDPRAALPHFPRPGDQFDLDAANPGIDTGDWTHGSGPVFRMVIALGPKGVRGQDMLPGGQSGRPTDPFFNDQAARWLANETSPIRYLPEEVVAGATGLERYAP